MRFFPNRSVLVLCMMILTAGVVAAQEPEGVQTAEAYPVMTADAPLADEASLTGTAPELSVFSVMKFSGRLVGADGSPLTGTTGVTFAFYSEQSGGTPLWLETQTVTLDADGRYTILLGSQSATGLPVELFSAGEARWLTVETLSGPEPTRILLVTVPYAMKAAEADRLGGRAADEFVLNETLETAVRDEVRAQIELDATLRTDPTGPDQALTGAGLAGRFARWTTDTSIGASVVTADPTGKIGIGTETPVTRLEVSGSVTATSYFGDGTTLTGVPTVNGSNTFQGVQNIFQWFGATEVDPLFIFRGNFDDDLDTNPEGMLMIGNVGTGTGLLVRSLRTAITGLSTQPTGFPVGLSGIVQADNGTGIFGLARSTTGGATGLLGESEAANGFGIRARGLHVTGPNFGLSGETFSSAGTAIRAIALDATGTTLGLLVDVASPSGALISAVGGGTELFGVDGAGNVRANAYFDLAGNPVGGAGVGDITSIVTNVAGGLEGGVTTGDATLTLLTTCAADDVLAWDGAGNWGCAPDANSGGTVTDITAGTGLTGGLITTSGAIAIDTSIVPQLNTANTFTAGTQLIQTIGTPTVVGLAVQADAAQSVPLQEWRDSAGGVVASVDVSGVFTGDGSGLTGLGTGDITGIITGGTSGLQGGDVSGDVTLALATCTSGQVLASTGPGTWACAASGGTGTVTSVDSGLGLTGGPFTDTGTIAIDTSIVPQLNAANTFTAGTQLIQTIGTPAVVGLAVQADAAQSVPLQEWRDSAGGVIARVDLSGDFRANAYLDLGGNPIGGTGTVTSVGSGAGLTGGPITDAGTLSLTPCTSGEVLASTGGGNWACTADADSGGDITEVVAGAGLTGGATTGSAPLSLEPCTAGQVLASTGGGNWACTADADSGGTVTSITAGTGLTGTPNPIIGIGTLDVNFNTAQRRVTNTCSAGTFFTFINSGGIATCDLELGDITGVVAGTGLTGGATTGSASLSLITSCSTDEVLAWDGVSAWACSAVVQVDVANTFTVGQIITTSDVSALHGTSTDAAAMTLRGTATDATASSIGVFGESAGFSGSGVYGKTTGIGGVGGTFENTVGGAIIEAIDISGTVVFRVAAGGLVTTTGSFSGSGALLTDIPTAALASGFVLGTDKGGTGAITPAQALVNLGAAEVGHDHDGTYVLLAGDTMTGALVSSVASTADAVTVSSGYINLALTAAGSSPASTDCDDASEHGRMKVDASSGNESLWVCTATGWKSVALI